MLKLSRHVLTSRLGLRIVLLFVLCALVPMVAMVGFSLVSNDAQLDHQMQRWLHQETKFRGLALFERLSLLERELRLCGETILLARDQEESHIQLQQDALRARFRSLVLARGDQVSTFFGDEAIPRAFTEEERAHLAAGKAVLLTAPAGNAESSAYLALSLLSAKPEAGVLWGEVNVPFIMGLTDSAGYGRNMQLLLVDHEGHLLHAAGEGGQAVQRQLREGIRLETAGEFRWTMENQRHLAYSWPIYLRVVFHAPFLAMIFSIPEEDVFALPYTVKSMLPQVFVLTILAVALLSLVQVRRNLQPLKALTEGTRKIADKRFDTRVHVVSNDEFGDLASAFNDMALHLEGQFNTLSAIAEIDRSVLSSRKRDEIVETVLRQMQLGLRFDMVGLTLHERGTGGGAMTYIARAHGGRRMLGEALSPFAAGLFDNCPERMLTLRRDDNRLPSVLREEKDGGIDIFVLLPIFQGKRQPDVMILGRNSSEAPLSDIAAHARSVADQVGVALVNASLTEELHDMSWGALHALARAVDAKSPWTAGHSERVTQYALKIGRVLGLGESEMDTLHRGALLHDIGKIGVAGALLDKPGRLSAEEYALVKMHPSLGGKILEPIKAYTHVLNIVVQHHERVDGKGYPRGLAGEDIDFAARILAVADVFDAVSSDRPYRKGWTLERCIGLIQDGRGQAFDPAVVDGFLELIAREGELLVIRPGQGTLVESSLRN